MRYLRGSDNRLLLVCVLVALGLFATISLVLPGLDDTGTVIYRLLLFVFTLSGVVLLFFAGTLIIDGIRRFFFLVAILREILRKRTK